MGQGRPAGERGHERQGGGQGRGHRSRGSGCGGREGTASGPGSPPRSAASVGRLAEPLAASAARAAAAPGRRGAPSTRPPRCAERRHLRRRAQPAAAAQALREQPAASPLAANGPAPCGAHAHSTALRRPYLRAPLGRLPAGANRRGCSAPGCRNGPPEHRSSSHFNKSVPALKEHKNNAHTLLLARSYLRSQPGRPRARHGELTPRWPLVPELLPLPLLGLEERR